MQHEMELLSGLLLLLFTSPHFTQTLGIHWGSCSRALISPSSSW